MIRRIPLLTLCLTAALGATARAEPAVLARGHHLAQVGCASCHAVEPTGDSPNPAAPRFRDLAAFEPGHGIDEVFARGVLVGHPGMPSFGLTEQEQADLLAYVRALQPRSAP